MRIASLLRRLAPVLCALALLMLTGCGQSVPAEAAQGGPGIQSISFSRTTADGNDSFDFSIWQLGEAYYFSDAAVIGGDGTAEPVSREVTEADMTRARDIAAQYGIKAYLEAYKKPLIDLAPGEAVYKTELTLDDGTVLSADTQGSWGDALEVFFKELSAE